MSRIEGTDRLRCDHCGCTWNPGSMVPRYFGENKHFCCVACSKGTPPKVATNAEPGRKDDARKLRYDLVPTGALAEVVKVLTFGAAKYWDDNWQKIEAPRKRYTAALLRHVESWRAGERNDPESGAHHLAHATCCALFLIWGDDHGF